MHTMMALRRRPSAPLRNGCSLIYAESDTISCYHPPLRIQPCTLMWVRGHIIETPSLCRLISLCIAGFLPSLELLMNVTGNFQNIEIKWKGENVMKTKVRHPCI